MIRLTDANALALIAETKAAAEEARDKAIAEITTTFGEMRSRANEVLQDVTARVLSAKIALQSALNRVQSDHVAAIADWELVRSESLDALADADDVLAEGKVDALYDAQQEMILREAKILAEARKNITWTQWLHQHLENATDFSGQMWDYFTSGQYIDDVLHELHENYLGIGEFIYETGVAIEAVWDDPWGAVKNIWEAVKNFDQTIPMIVNEFINNLSTARGRGKIFAELITNILTGASIKAASTALKTGKTATSVINALDNAIPDHKPDIIPENMMANAGGQGGFGFGHNPNLPGGNGGGFFGGAKGVDGGVPNTPGATVEKYSALCATGICQCVFGILIWCWPAFGSIQSLNLAYRKRIKHLHEPGHVQEFTFSCYKNQPFVHQYFQVFMNLRCNARH